MRLIRTILGISLVAAAIALPGPVRADDLSRGEAMIENYFRKQVAQISSKCLTDYTSRREWEEARPELRRQLLEMLGLDPLPARTDLKVQSHGKVEAAKYTIEKLTFQSSPNLYV